MPVPLFAYLHISFPLYALSKALRRAKFAHVVFVPHALQPTPAYSSTSRASKPGAPTFGRSCNGSAFRPTSSSSPPPCSWTQPLSRRTREPLRHQQRPSRPQLHVTPLRRGSLLSPVLVDLSCLVASSGLHAVWSRGYILSPRTSPICDKTAQYEVRPGRWSCDP